MPERPALFFVPGAADDAPVRFTVSDVTTVDGDRRYYNYTYRFDPTPVDLPPTPRTPEVVRVSDRGSTDTTDTTPTRTATAGRFDPAVQFP